MRAGLAMYFVTLDDDALMELAGKIVAELGIEHFFNIQLVGDSVIEINPRISTIVYQDDLNLPYLGVKRAIGEISDDELRALRPRIRPAERPCAISTSSSSTSPDGGAGGSNGTSDEVARSQRIPANRLSFWTCPGVRHRFKPTADMTLRVTHCPVNVAGIPWENVQALRRKGVEARLVVFNRGEAAPRGRLVARAARGAAAPARDAVRARSRGCSRRPTSSTSTSG